jgi:hypothetical protein
MEAAQLCTAVGAKLMAKRTTPLYMRIPQPTEQDSSLSTWVAMALQGGMASPKEAQGAVGISLRGESDIWTVGEVVVLPTIDFGISPPAGSPSKNVFAAESTTENDTAGNNGVLQVCVDGSASAVDVFSVCKVVGDHLKDHLKKPLVLLDVRTALVPDEAKTSCWVVMGLPDIQLFKTADVNRILGLKIDAHTVTAVHVGQESMCGTGDMEVILAHLFTVGDTDAEGALSRAELKRLLLLSGSMFEEACVEEVLQTVAETRGDESIQLSDLLPLLPQLVRTQFAEEVEDVADMDQVKPQIVVDIAVESDVAKGKQMRVFGARSPQGTFVRGDSYDCIIDLNNRKSPSPEGSRMRFMASEEPDEWEQRSSSSRSPGNSPKMSPQMERLLNGGGKLRNEKSNCITRGDSYECTITSPVASPRARPPPSTWAPLRRKARRQRI